MPIDQDDEPISSNVAAQILAYQREQSKKLDKLIDAVSEQGTSLTRLLEFREQAERTMDELGRDVDSVRAMSMSVATQAASELKELRRDMESKDEKQEVKIKALADQVIEWRGSIRVLIGLLGLGEIVVAIVEVYTLTHGSK